MEFTAIIDDIANYYRIPRNSNKLNINYLADEETEFIALDLPFKLPESTAPYLAIYLKNKTKLSVFTKLKKIFPAHIKDYLL